MTYKVIVTGAFRLAVLLALVCAGAGATEIIAGADRTSGRFGGKLLITGSSTLCPLITETGKHFQILHPEIHVEVQCGGSGRGISDVREGKSAIGMVSRTLTDQEKDLYGFPIARDGLSIILNKDNPVKSLSNAQVAGIYTGRISNWKKVGGRSAPIMVLNPKSGYGSVDLFNNYFNMKYEDIKAGQVVGDNQSRITVVAGNPNAIAYLSAGEAERQASSGVSIRLLPINMVMPTRRNIITGNYPVNRPLILVTKGLPSGMAKTFIDYCLSSAIVGLIESYDFVPYED